MRSCVAPSLLSTVRFPWRDPQRRPRPRDDNAVGVAQFSFRLRIALITLDELRRRGECAQLCGFEIGDIEACRHARELRRQHRIQGKRRRRVEHRREQAALHRAVTIQKFRLRRVSQRRAAVYLVDLDDFPTEKLRGGRFVAEELCLSSLATARFVEEETAQANWPTGKLVSRPEAASSDSGQRPVGQSAS